MKKIFTTLACAVMVAASNFSASAVDLNEEFSLTTGIYVPFTAPQTGTLTAKLTPGLFSMLGTPTSILKSSQSESADVEMKIVTDNGTYATVVSWDVTQSETYYFYATLTEGPQTITLTMGDVSELPTPESTVELGKAFPLPQGSYETYYSEEAGVLTAKFSAQQQNTTEKATILYTQWNSADNVGEGFVSFTTNKAASSSYYTEQYYEVKANTLYYISGNTVITNNPSVTLSFQAESAQDPATEIEWNTETTVIAGNDYYIIGKGQSAHIETNRTTDISIGGQLSLTNSTTNDPVALTPVVVNGNYYYNLPVLEQGVRYNFVSDVLGNNGVSLKFVEGTVEADAVAPTQISVGSQNLNNNTVYFYKATQDGTLVITTEQCDPSEIEGSIIFTNPDHTTALTGVQTGVDEAGSYTCSFPVENGVSYYIYFTTPNYIVATLNFDNGQSDVNNYMELPTLKYEADPNSPALFIFWQESIEAVAENGSVAGILTTPTGAEVAVTFNITTYYPEAEDEPNAGGETSSAANNALMLNLSQFIAQYGDGDYSIALAANVVKNLAGEVNNALEDTFSVAALPTVADIEPEITISGDNITITWDGEALSEFNPDGGDILIMSEDYSEEFRFSLGENAAIENGNTLVIDLTTVDLTEGATYELIVPEFYLYVGENNQGNALIDDTFTAQASAINSINAVDGKTVIYNLQGVKVQNPTKGLYIINGKKVLVK